MPAPSLHPHAAHAIRAALHLHSWGPHATRLYLRKRGVPLSLFYLAYSLSH